MKIGPEIVHVDRPPAESSSPTETNVISDIDSDIACACRPECGLACHGNCGCCQCYVEQTDFYQ